MARLFRALVVLLFLLPSFAVSVAADGTCVGATCASDERAGDHSSACEYGTPHDPRYRYFNASTQAEQHNASLSLTFACKSNPPNAEYFYGNLTYTDGQRTDRALLFYYYGELYWPSRCAYGVFVDPDWRPIIGDWHVGHPYRSTNACPNSGDYPSVVSTLP